MNHLWLAIGLGGQGAFGARFLVQWLVSERQRRSVIPMAFWWLSLAGGTVLLAYAIHRRDPVFIIGQAFGLVVYARNLTLIRRRQKRVRALALAHGHGVGYSLAAHDPHAMADHLDRHGS